MNNIDQDKWGELQGQEEATATVSYLQGWQL